jgi:hypothetical protein
MARGRPDLCSTIDLSNFERCITNCRRRDGAADLRQRPAMTPPPLHGIEEISPDGAARGQRRSLASTQYPATWTEILAVRHIRGTTELPR